MLVLAGKNRAREELLQRIELGFQHAAVGEFDKAHSAVVRRGNNRSQRTLQPRDDESFQGTACFRPTSERPPECVAESAFRLITGSDAGVFPIRTSPNV